MHCYCMFSLGAVLFAAPAHSQSNTATFAGRVVDPQGAAIPAAAITVRNTDVASSRTLTSGSDGSFRVAGLIPGAYTVEARSGSLHTRTPVRLTLTLGSSTEITLHFDVAAVKQSTTVTARRGTVEGNTIAPPPNTAEASVGSFLPGLTVTYLPNRDRDFTQFTNQAAATTDDADGTGVSIAGQRSRALAVQVDGTSFIDPLLGGRRGAEDGAVLLPLSAVREFQVLHSGVDASVGDTGAGLISVATSRRQSRAAATPSTPPGHRSSPPPTPSATRSTACRTPSASATVRPSAKTNCFTSPASSRTSCTRRTTFNSLRKLRAHQYPQALPHSKARSSSANPPQPYSFDSTQTSRSATPSTRN